MDTLGHEIWGTIREEFSDVPSAADMTRLVLRLGLAAILGGLIGYEREHKGKGAGLRTHMLVAIGAALFVLVPQQAGWQEPELSRVLQGLLGGVGFLGAGAIVKGHGEAEPKGLTTAAGLWLTAAIGVAAGLGRATTALVSTLLALVILALVARLTRGPQPPTP